MKSKKMITSLLGAAMVFALAGCGSTGNASSAQSSSASQASTSEAVAEASSAASSVEETEASVSSSSAETAASTEENNENVLVRVGSLQGPTSMGLVNLRSESEAGNAKGSYEFTMETQPDAIAASFVKGDLDIALIPANLAAVLYNKTEGGISVIDINTLGVLYCVTGDTSVTSVADLSGKTVYTTGQGASPEYVMNYLLQQNGITDCTLEFRSEATEVAAVLAEDPNAIAVLPQPFVTVAEAQNEALHTAFSLTDEWDAVTADGSKLVTGVTVVRNEFLDANKAAVDLYLSEKAESVEKASSDVEGTAALVAQYGIIEKAPIAQKALPYCNIAIVTGEEMKTSLSGYLNVLFTADPKSVGGALPGDDFYYLG
ncbi:MAG: ABC transporter substrate-binding protein [Eubacterium sp.]|nr:ABC transporter substrate-binding protein [Eubacterium sp.]